MKKHVQLIMAMVMVIPMLSFANPIERTWDFEKTKTIKKEFSVNPDALLKINNKYGNVDVISWDQNKVVIEVTITVKGNNESKVLSRLEKIDVDFTNSPNEVVAKTILENSSGNWFKSNDNINYQIDYKVKMPMTNSADLSNDYGSISLNEIKGKATINCDYGKIILGSLHHADNSINIDYTSDSEIEFMNGGSINADYSKLRVVKANRVELNADYTDSHFESVGELNFNCDYGTVETGSANIIDGRGDYLNMRFGAISKRLGVQADYGKVKVDKLMKGFERLSIETDYATIKIGLDKDVSFNFIAKLSYAGFDYDGDNITYLKKVVKTSSSHFEGFVNKENSGSTIEITSEYGGVNMYNN